MKEAVKAASALHNEILPAVAEVLRRAPAPLTIAQLRRNLMSPFRVTAKQQNDLVALLQSTSTDGIHIWPGSKTSPRFWSRGAVEVATTAALEIASRTPVDARNLVRSLSKEAYKYPPDAARKLIEELVAAGKLHEDPPWGRTRKLSTRRPDPERYRNELEFALRPILEKYAALGITPQALVDEVCARTPRAEPAPDAIAATILETLDRIEPRRGLVVAISKLRRAPELARSGKQQFDAAAMSLFAGRRVFLHDHTAPHTLTAVEKEDLVTDGKGNYYVGIARREPELEPDAGVDS